MSVNLKTANYTGQAKNFERHGFGSYRYSADFLYAGNYAQNVKQGAGEFSMSGNFLITGNFVDGEITGIGTKTWMDGNRYEGEFLNGEFHGHGTFTAKRFTYVGGFKHNKFSGNGRLEKDDGSIYKGNFANNKLHGVGEFTRNGSKYIGDFAHGEFHGQGVLSAQSWRHEGTFKDGKKHGPGTFVDEISKFFITTIWKEDVMEIAPAIIAPTVSTAQGVLQTMVADKKKKFTLQTLVTAPFTNVPVVNVTNGALLPTVSIDIVSETNEKLNEWGRVLQVRLLQRFADAREKNFPFTLNGLEHEFKRCVIAQGATKVETLQLPALSKGQYLLEFTDVTACNAPGFSHLPPGQVLLNVT